MSNASHRHILGRPINQQYETGPYANPLLSRASDSATELRGAASQCGQGWSARPEDNSRTRGGQDPATEPGHRGWPESSGARPVSVASHFYLRWNPSSKLFGEQQEDKTRPQSPATEVGQRVQGRGQ